MLGAFAAQYDSFASLQGVLDLHRAEIYRKNKVIGANERIYFKNKKKRMISFNHNM